GGAGAGRGAPQGEARRRGAADRAGGPAQARPGLVEDRREPRAPPLGARAERLDGALQERRRDEPVEVVSWRRAARSAVALDERRLAARIPTGDAVGGPAGDVGGRIPDGRALHVDER